VAAVCLLEAGIGDIDTTLEEVESRLLCLSRLRRAAYLLADVLGLTDTDGAEIPDYTRQVFRQRVSRARRTLRQVIDN